MPHGFEIPLRACKWLLLVASRIAPPFSRSEWLVHWHSELRSWFILYERGEVAVGAAAFVRAAFASAWALRVEQLRLGRCLRSPWFVLAACAAALMVLIAGSGGFPVTQSLIQEALGPPRRTRFMHENRVFVYSAPIVLALGTAVVLIWLNRVSLRRGGWGYWAFFAIKTTTILAVMPLLWIEGGAALRAQIVNFPLRVFGGGLFLSLVFIAMFSYALRWSFADQRQRCPECLRRLSLPVTLGSWASMFDPAKTELLCEEGHGALAVSEVTTGEPDRWVKLDTTWQA